MSSAIETKCWGAPGESSFLCTSALLFAASTAATVLWTGSMSGGMEMPGGWTMSMAWMRMPTQSWLAAASSFLGMWLVMMVAMMLPSLTGTLLSYRRSLRRLGGAPLGRSTVLAAAEYFLVWLLVGAAVYPLGIALAAAAMRWEGLSRSVPFATGAVVLCAGCLQLSGWKRRQLVLCRDSPEYLPRQSADARGAWSHGLHLGIRCVLCCSGYTIILLVAGVMDLAVMGSVGAAMTLERLAPWQQGIARTAGVAGVAAGAVAALGALQLS